MKKYKTIYWTATIIIFLFDSVMPAFTSHTPLAVEGIRHLGYPDYFRVMLTFFKVTGGFLLIIPAIPRRFKEWAYAGFGFNFICAGISNWAVDGFGPGVILSLTLFVILAVSYVCYNKLQESSYRVAQA